MSTVAAALADQHQQNQAAFEKHASHVAGLEREAASLEKRLHAARQILDTLSAKRTEIARQIALEKQKPAAIENVSAEINNATIRVQGFESLLSEKRAEIASHAGQHEQLRKAAHDSGTRLRLRTTLEALEAKGDAVADRINNKLLELLRTDFVEWDELCGELDALIRTDSRGTDGQRDPELMQAIIDARNVLGRFAKLLFEGSRLRIEQDLVREGWEVRGPRVELGIVAPPKASSQAA
jgi:hypothetical protein